MQKINRDTLKAALACGKHPQQAQMFLATHGVPYWEYRDQAAAILLELTDPEFVPSYEMTNAALDRPSFNGLFADIFCGMIKELVE
jgi:hypothetical protein